ncbi:MAG: translocation/assembly module TamB domain-containing protein [Bacteroidetes bacterium]|nr:translocation/assembly module TamB domain-containing protein [Bacteroidota bacterium]
MARMGSRLLKIFLKTVSYSSLAVLGIVLLTLVLSQTGFFRSFLLSTIVSEVNTQLNGRIEVQELQGNFFSNLTLKGLRISMGDTSVVELEELGLSYDVLSILDKKITIHEVRLVHPAMYVFEDSTGINLARLAKPSEPKGPEPIDSLAMPLGGFEIKLDRFVVEGGDLVFESEDLTAQIKNYNIVISAQVSGLRQHVNISKLGLMSVLETRRKGSVVKRDSLELKNMTLLAEAHAFKPSLRDQARNPSVPDSTWINLQELRILTEQTDVFLKADVVLPDSAEGIKLHYNAEMRAYPLSLSDIRKFADIGLTRMERVEIELATSGDGSRATLRKLNLLTSAGDFSGTADVDYGSEPLGYVADLSFNGINAGVFLDQPDLIAVLNGKVHADGVGLDPEKMISQFNFEIHKSKFGGVDIENFQIDAKVRDGLAELSTFQGVTNAGNFNCTGFYRLTDESYRLETSLRGINIGDVLADTVFRSSINLNFALEGQGLNPATSHSSLVVTSDSSKIMGRDLNRLVVKGSHSKGRIYLEQLNLRTPIAEVNAAGEVGLDSTFDISYDLRTLDFDLLKKYVGQDSTMREMANMELEFHGQLSGSASRLETSGNIVLTNLAFSDLRVDSLNFSYFLSNILPSEFMGPILFSRVDSSVIGDFLLYTHKISMPGTTISDFSTSISKESGRTHFDVSAFYEELAAYAKVKGTIALENPQKGSILLDKLLCRVTGKSIKTREVMVELGGDPIIDTTYDSWVENWENNKPIDVVFDMEKNIYDIRSFSMDVGRGLVSVFGSLDITGDQNMDIKIKDLDMSRANALIGSKESVVEGLLNMNASIKGSFERPILLGDWNILNGKASEFVYNSFLGNLQYLNRKIQVNMTLNQNKDKTLTVGGYLPIDLSFKDVPERFTRRPMNFKIHSEGIDLRFLQAFFGKALVLNRGEIKIDLKVSGNKEKPSLEGEMKIEDGMMSFPRTSLGQSFRNVRMFTRLTPDKIFLDTLSVQSGKDPSSNMFVNGSLDVSELMKDFDFERIDKITYDFNAVFNNFVPINTKSESSYLHTARLTGNINVSAPQSLFYTVVKGDVQIRNAEIWVVESSKARSVAAVSAKPIAADTVPAIDYYKNLDLDISVSLPENSDNGIRSAEMLLGLFGDIIVTKPPESEDFFISGNVSTKKGGKYAYLSIAFNIERGDITFKGEPGVNPTLDILAVKRFTYKYEQEDIQAEAQIKVSGQLLKPEIAITAVERGTDNPLPDLTEPADIVSYLILGVKTRDIAKLDPSQAGDFAKQVAINQVLNAVANQAGLSKLEYIPSTTGAGATVEIGKRITEDIQVTFSGGNDPTVGQVLTLEVVADSMWGFKKFPLLRKWKKTIEFEYKKPSQEETDKQDIINLILYFRKEY